MKIMHGKYRMESRSCNSLLCTLDSVLSDNIDIVAESSDVLQTLDTFLVTNL